MYAIDILHHYQMHNGKIIQYNGKIDRPKQPAKPGQIGQKSNILAAVAIPLPYAVDIHLQQDETDMAIWLGQGDFERIVSDLDSSIANAGIGASCSGDRIRLAAVGGSREDDDQEGEESISIHQFRGIYPCGNEKCGIAQGNRFMLEKYFWQ